MPSLALVDDHGLFRTALRRLLETEAHLDVVAEASDGREAVARSIEIRPDLVLMDVELPGISGVEATRQIREALPDCKVLILSGYDRSDFVQAALTAGASGYVLKTATSEELLAAVRAVLDGKCYLSPDAARYVVDRFAKPASAGTPTLGSLSNREREVLQLVAEGLDRLHTALHRRGGERERNDGNDVRSPHPQVGPPVGPHVDPRHRLTNAPLQGRGDRVQGAREGDHRAVGVGVGVDVEHPRAAPIQGRGDGVDDGGVPTLAEVRDGLDQGHLRAARPRAH